MGEKTLGKARGLNSIADPSSFKGSRGTGDRRPRSKRGSQLNDPSLVPAPMPEEEPLKTVENIDLREITPPTDKKLSTTHAARRRRELSIPLPVARALEATGINPADIVMAAYRKYADSIYAGDGGRLVSRGRERLRLSVTDNEFEKIARLGQARGWNKSETVSVLLSRELLTDRDS